MTAVTAEGTVRRRIEIRGLVQGVGFRPFVARLATELGIAGWCRNDATCVIVEAEGMASAVAAFESRLRTQAPPLARVHSCTGMDLAPHGTHDFDILASCRTDGERTLVAPDTAVCQDCLRELADPGDRRYRHPFITCTNCGPRLTITLDLPYDRPVTTMAGFAMCPACAAEYADPTDRRYHAQPICCHDCGPRLQARTPDGAVAADGTEAVLEVAVRALRTGGIVAVKGIGGYHLACDATDHEAVQRLRARKNRPDQPFAVMVRDLDTAAQLVDIGTAATLLTSPERPIVLLPRRIPGADADPGSEDPDRSPSAVTLSGAVAPGLEELGIMLPYAPVHHLLFASLPDGSPGAPQALVMTSGNVSGEPLCHTEDDALTRLAALADLFVVHDRPIAVPVEDSVLAWSVVGPVPVRRSRGLAPLPVGPTDDGSPACVLAAGAELKNTVALSQAGRTFVSAHVGDVESLSSRLTHRQVIDQLLRFHRARPALVVADLHPGYASRAAGRRLADEWGVPLLGVQHHHAHLASLAAEHGRLDEPLLGLVFDGTGYGCDRSVWGGEVLVLTRGGAAVERVGHLGTIRLPGGDAGVRNPVRTAALALLAAGESWQGTPVAAALTGPETTWLTAAHESAAGYLPTTSVGRLFDVVASVIGVRHRISYDAQAAIELEAAAHRWRRERPSDPPPYLPLPVDGGVLDPDPLVRALAGEIRAGADPGSLAWAFHDALARASAAAAADVAAATGLGVIGLSGGVFVNRVLLDRTRHHLAGHGLSALTHAAVPANDGGLALGQVAVGRRRLANPMPGDLSAGPLDPVCPASRTTPGSRPGS
ncbi:MAG: carbamoyltransferase HypF [Actinomycetales bacterium]